MHVVQNALSHLTPITQPHLYSSSCGSSGSSQPTSRPTPASAPPRRASSSAALSSTGCGTVHRRGGGARGTMNQATGECCTRTGTLDNHAHQAASGLTCTHTTLVLQMRRVHALLPPHAHGPALQLDNRPAPSPGHTLGPHPP